MGDLPEWLSRAFYFTAGIPVILKNAKLAGGMVGNPLEK